MLLQQYYSLQDSLVLASLEEIDNVPLAVQSTCYQLQFTIPFLHALLLQDVYPGLLALKILGHKYRIYRSPENQN